MTTTTETMKKEILRQMPLLIEQDPAFCATLARALRGEFLPRSEAESRFDRLLLELRQDREAQERKWEEMKAESERKWEEMKAESERKWEEHNRKWDEAQAEGRRKWEEMKAESERKWEENNRKWEENNRRWDEAQAESRLKWEENNRKWEENNRRWDDAQAESRLKWEENNRKWEENNRKWDENQRQLREMNDALLAKIDRSIGALGARWGMQSEQAFRNALAGILEKNFDVRVFNVTEYDEAGEVFGRPEQVELDIIIKNGLLLACELKSSLDKSAMYAFERKVRFYEKLHQRKADRLIVVSPMIDPHARKVGERLGLEMYSDSPDVPVS